MKKPYLIVFAVALVLLLGYGAYQAYRNAAFQPTLQENVVESPPSDEIEEIAPGVEIIAKNLTIPWEIAFLPNGELLVTERPGTLLKIGFDPSTGSGQARIPIEGVEHRGEGGLLGMALHPNFEENGWVYLYLTTRTGSGLINRVERYRLDGNSLRERTTIIDNIPGASLHDGGRLKFGPDGMLFVTTGDAGDEDSAQDLNSLAGKILRLTDDGSIPEDNPYQSPVWSYGHRNPQGIAWDADGTMWSTEHGRSGVFSGFDELNKIKKGENYGWPIIQGDELRVDMETPLINSGPDITWAPASAEYFDGSIFFGGLRGESLYEAKIGDGVVVGFKVHFQREFGRIRTVRVGPDGMLYLTTSNRDGGGTAREGDDKIIRVNPAILE